ncbi:MAG TPA: serine hydrolase [Allosphingosinicella sp.]|jgi:CubicO group peptidase (beta-lactamase class C family)
MLGRARSTRAWLRIGCCALGASALSRPALAQEQTGPCPPPPPAAGGPAHAHTRFLEANLLPAVVAEGAKPFTLAERMCAYNVPGVSVAVIHGGRIDWARGWGVRDAATCAPVTPRTAFQAASISKVATALLALRLAERGRIDLDRDINAYLTSWKLPSDDKRAPGFVTLRQLLSHTAGLNVHGFPGYRPGAPLPTAVQVLGGAPPANTEAVRMVLPPGGQWQYSGGGYVLAQQAITDVTRQPFDRLATREIFAPLGMDRSSFAQPPTRGILADAASGHSGGRVIDGRYHVYPELGAAGLWTTPSDLARLLIDVQAAAAGRRSRVLAPAATAAMLTPVKGGWGLGPALSGTGPGRRFGHDGANEGFQSAMVAYVEKGEGVVVLTNGDQGRRLADEIVRAVAADYGWAELAGKPLVEVALPEAALARLAGAYQGGGLSVFLDLREGRLYAQTGGPSPERLVALSPVRFRAEVSGIMIEFDTAPDGAVTGFRILEGAPPLTLLRTESPAADLQRTPLFLRGSMNDWSTSLPLAPAGDGALAAEIPLAAGDYQFKLASEDWRSADLGASGTEAIAPDAGALALVPHGGNVRLTVPTPARYRFELRTAGDKASLTVRRVAAGPSPSQ